MDEQIAISSQHKSDPVFDQTAISKVLVLDDSRAQRKLLSAILRRWGFEVIEAACGKDALEICKVERIHLIISDWMMPGMSGLDFCRAYRALDLEYYGYFILLTSKSEKQEVAQGLDVGADDFLTKPFHASELRARIAAAARILSMEQQLQEKNRLVHATLDELRGLYEKLDRDLIEARKLQQSLVPDRFRDFDGTHVSLLLHQSGHVGGDLVGLFRVNDAQIGLFAIDVSGHGISSALMTARLAGYLSAATSDQNLAMTRQQDGSYQSLPPGKTAARLNELSLEEMQTEHYLPFCWRIWICKPGL